jgi:Ca2+-transporting ATPase
MSDEELRRRVKDTILFTRINPVNKLRIVEALQANGEVVAMTGDGVNDAPALKKANIGIVVSGATDVAKETADIVLLDDNFSTIVAAVEEGRGIFENLRKVILYLLSDSFAEVIMVMGSLFLGIPLPLTASQILWINLISDGFPSLALTIEPKDEGLMRQKPRDKNGELVDFEIRFLIGLISAVTGAVTLAAFFWLWKMHGEVDSARTVAFSMLGVNTLIYVFSARSLRKPIWQTSLFSNLWLVLAVFIGFMFQLAALYTPFLQKLFETRELTGFEWVLVAGEAMLVISLIEIVKWRFTKEKLARGVWVAAD